MVDKVQVVKISVVIPNFNKEQYLSETLDSLLNQEFEEWEAIVVDDGSTDSSVSIIQKYVQKDQRIKFFYRNRNPKGASVCRNIGIEKALGEYIIFLDSDDILTSQALKQRIKLMKIYHYKVDFLVFPVGHFYKKIGDCSMVQIAEDKNNHVVQFLSYNYQWHTSSPIWKKDFLYRLDMFDEEYPRLQDIELHTRALLYENVQYKIISTQEIDFYYRIDENRTLQNPLEKSKNYIEGNKLFLNKMYLIIKNKYDEKIYYDALKNLFYKMMYYVMNQDINMSKKLLMIKQIIKFDIFSKIMTWQDKIRFYYLFLRRVLGVRKKLRMMKQFLWKEKTYV